jgi:hypothetical protein
MGSWLHNFGLELAESPTFARGGGLTDVQIFKLKDDPDYDEAVPITDVAL